MINCRYRIINELGAGGSGTVFLVEDTLWNNSQRALKVLTHLPGPGSGTEDPFLAEISALLSIRHPHLVTLYDFDTVRQSTLSGLAGCRFFTMEYVKGSDALSWVTRIPHEAGWAGVIKSLLAQSLSVLSWIHAHNLIHSDIKPQNLLVSDDHAGASPPVLKLTDFGFSRTGDLSDNAPARGTMEYAAPEVLTGEETDKRIDLYSLGATFYHLMEGHCPFESATPVGLIKRVLTEEPQFSSALWNEEPDMLEVVRSLLKKDPGERPSTAREAALMLGGDVLPVQGADVLHQFVVPFVGRDRELQHIHDILAAGDVQRKEELPTAALVLGPDGMGKSRLVEEVIRAVRISGRRVLTATGVPGGVPYSSIRPLLRMVDIELRSSPESDSSPVPETTSTVKEYLAEADVDEEGAARVGLLDREATVEALARFVVDSASRVPWVLVAEDLHTMDEQSVQVLEIVARDVPRGRGALIATSAMNSVWSSSLPGVVEIPLVDLAPADVVRLTVSALGLGPASEALGSRLHEVLGGMPVVILEALRSLQESVSADFLRENAETALAVIERIVPKDADKLFYNRFFKLTREQQLLFAVLCCFENPAPVRLAVNILPFHPVRTRTLIRDLEGNGLLAFAENEARIAVRVGRMKKVVYESLGADALMVHQMVVAAMNSMVDESSPTDLQELGYQHGVIGEHAQASAFLERAATRMLLLHAFQPAIGLFSRAADAAQASGDPERVIALRSQEADALFQAGMTKEALGLGASLLTGTPPTGEGRRRLLRTVSLARSNLGDFESARDGIRELIDGATCEGERAELMQELVHIEINLGGFKKAEVACLDQLPIAERLGNEQLKATIFTDVGISVFLQGRFDDAARYFQDALETYERIGDAIHVTSALTNIGNALNARGDSAAAIEQWRLALDHVAVSGTMSQEARIQNNLGIAYFANRQYAEARRCYAHSRELFHRLGARTDLAYTLTNLGEVMLADGDYGDALQVWTEALDFYAMMEDTRGLAETYLQLAELRITLGDCIESEELLKKAQRHIEADGIDLLKGPWAFWYGTLKASKGDLPGALTLLRDADTFFVSAGEEQKSFRTRVRIAECAFRSGEPREAADQLRTMLAMPERRGTPLLRAEALYLMGLIERQVPGATGEHPLVHFKAAMDLQEREPICEVTWKLTYALAKEFFERGQRERARPFLVQTEKVLRHFVSCLPTEELRSVYLAVEGRAQVLANIDRHGVV